MDIREVFARNLRRIRHGKDLPREALPHEADMDRTYISSLERGMCNASIETVARLADVLGIEPDELLRRASKPSRSKIRKRRLRVTMTIELSALARTVRACDMCCKQRLAATQNSLTRL